MKGESTNFLQSPNTQSQDNCPLKKPSQAGAEISLETLEILLTSVPEEELNFSSDENISPHKQQQNINSVIQHKSHYSKRLKHLIKRRYGAEWLYRNLSYFQTQFPWEVISLLENMAHENNPDIILKSLKPANEFRVSEDLSEKYDNKVIGKIEGLQILTINIRRLIYNSLEQPLKQLTPELIANCSPDELNEWNHWCSEIELHIHNIEQLLRHGQSFFSLRNFRLMEQLALSQRSKTALKSIIDKISSQTQAP